MEFCDVVGSRRSIRWFHPHEPVSTAAIQCVLEAARLVSCPGNVQPWRAVVVVQQEMPQADREVLLDAGNRQWPQVLAPVWIYWYGDPDAAVPAAFVERVVELLPTGAPPRSFGWTEETVRASVEEGRPMPPGLPSLEAVLHEMPYEETNGACQVAQLAAVDEGLGTCLLAVAHPARHGEVKRVLGVPERFVPVWLQVLGHCAESREAGGQRPRLPFEEIYAWGRWGIPLPRDPRVVEDLTRRRLLQAPAPLTGRFDELARLAEVFGIGEEVTS
jgi:nitroreductase